MNVIEFLNNEFRNIVKEYNNSHECSYCVPNSLQGKKEIVSFIISDLEEQEEYWGLYDNAKTLLTNIETVLNLQK